MDQNEGQWGARTERQQTNRVVIKTLGEIKEIFRKEGEKFDKKNLDKIDQNPPRKPAFPIIILSMAIFKDVVDVLDFTVVGIVVTTVLTFLCSTMIFFWCWGKISGGVWKKVIIRWMLWGVAIVFFVEIIPYVKEMPANTIFILMAHYKETKIVRLFTLALEKIHEAKIIDRVNKG